MMLGTLSSVSSLGSVPENRVDSDSLLGLSEVKGHHHRHLWVGGLVRGGGLPCPQRLQSETTAGGLRSFCPSTSSFPSVSCMTSALIFRKLWM